MRLFKEDNFNVVIDPEAKIIPEFKSNMRRLNQNLDYKLKINRE